MMLKNIPITSAEQLIGDLRRETAFLISGRINRFYIRSASILHRDSALMRFSKCNYNPQNYSSPFAKYVSSFKIGPYRFSPASLTCAPLNHPQRAYPVQFQRSIRPGTNVSWEKASGEGEVPKHRCERVFPHSGKKSACQRLSDMPWLWLSLA